MDVIRTFRADPARKVAFGAFALLLFAVVLGGASRQHELRLAVVELAAIPVLTLGLLQLSRVRIEGHSLALSILASTVALPLIQLIPLPPALWTRMPGRGELELALEVASLRQGWLPLSLTPDRSWQSALALLPPIAMFVGVLAVHFEFQRRLIYLLLLSAAAAVLLGAVQLASGSEQFYPWRTTSAGSVVGFFANRNHLATLCLMSIPFAAVLAGRAIQRDGAKDRLTLWLGIVLIAILIVALGVIKSRAGIVLVGPVLSVSLAATWIAAGRGRPNLPFFGLVAAIAVAMAIVATYALTPIIARFDTTAASEGRFENWSVVADAAAKYLPFGSGVGSFDAVYRSVEPLERLTPRFFNQAHNDYLETWLETGWTGAALIVAFFVWFGRRSWAAWRAKPSRQRDLQRASTVAIGTLLLHSAGDYPLRTVTVATIFALCCAILEFAKDPDPQSRSNPRFRAH